jgi:hypothetical protein
MEERLMSLMIAGIVKNGVVVPNAPLPEGALVEIHLNAGSPEVSAELQAELDGWERASAEALQLVERLAHEMDADEKR